MLEISNADVQKIYKLNKQLTAIEENIYTLAQTQNQIAQAKLLKRENNITDYELNVDISFFRETDEDPLVHWLEPIPKDRRMHINNGENHNVTSCCWKQEKLNQQIHCWLLHRLYDDFNVSWNDILQINNVWFDINIRYQYSIEINL